MSDYSLIGKRMPRVDSRSKVMGKAKFTADLKLPGMLVGKVKRSPYAHARILSIDTSKAEALPGVKAIVTGADTEGVKWGVFAYTRDQQFIQIEKARYIGDEVAGVAAVDQETAQKALDLIDVQYEELPAVFEPMSISIREMWMKTLKKPTISGKTRSRPRKSPIFRPNPMRWWPGLTMKTAWRSGAPTAGPI
jgi:CO/xanthine dehydrogenase Mo-binding subunit